MIRVLVLTTAAGLGVCVLCLSIAMAIGGSGLMQHGWSFPHGVHVDVDGHHGRGDYGGPTTTKDLTWDGSTSLDIDAPADVRYVQAAGPAKLTVTGPAGAVDALSVSGGDVDYDGPNHGPRLQITLTAPNVDRFELDGDSNLTIENFDQDSLEIDMDGHAAAKVQGKARKVDLSLSGRGDADLGQLAAQDARVDISGSGSAILAPKGATEVDISGSGEVTLNGRPASLRSDISGSGRIIQNDAPPTAATPAASPAPAATAAPQAPARTRRHAK
ncbi:MAG: DUF2807 domain-containing protein [Proteobacteria bacterium]|nr:DUF2807 domain-containing protein [Pseudomonadota bacterium]